MKFLLSFPPISSLYVAEESLLRDLLDRVETTEWFHLGLELNTSEHSLNIIASYGLYVDYDLFINFATMQAFVIHIYSERELLILIC